VYQLFDPNQVAAIPSLHAAYPTLLLLFACRFFGARALVLTPYVLGVWVAVIYMGEHYVFDVVMGALYGVAAFFLTDCVLLRLRRAQPATSRAAPARRARCAPVALLVAMSGVCEARGLAKAVPTLGRLPAPGPVVRLAAFPADGPGRPAPSRPSARAGRCRGRDRPERQAKRLGLLKRSG
jgi:PAP2 superfamily